MYENPPFGRSTENKKKIYLLVLYNACYKPTNMTIDSGWIKILKKGAGAAFTQGCHIKPQVIFIDGQIKLMKSDAIRTWDKFLQFQFINVIKNAFKSGADTVVLGFDNYEYVPTAKSMTQRKRMRDTAALEFHAQQELPNAIPECWASAIKNRAFKTQVIALVIRNLRAEFKHDEERSLIIDYMGDPEIVGKPCGLPSIFSCKDPNKQLRRGECDIKAWPWAELGPLLIHSIDGDFLPIGMQQLTLNPKLHEISILRIKTKIDTCKCKDGAKREWEYVNVRLLKKFVEVSLPGSENPVSDFCAMVSAIGCDFTMSLPQIGPTSLWRQRHLIKWDIQDEAGLLKFLLLVMMHTHHKHLSHKFKSIHQVLHDSIDKEDMIAMYKLIYKTLHSSKSTPQRTQRSLWKTSRFAAHVQNSLWTLQYWTLLHDYVDPLTGDFGYCQVKNHVAFVE